MRSLFTTAAGAAMLAGAVRADFCGAGSTEINGNYYCKAVQGIQYQGLSLKGSYQKITNMDSDSGSCSSEPFGFSGNLAPFNEPLSVHLRGPMQLKQFAFYSPGASKKNKRLAHSHFRRHGHSHMHAEEPVEKRAVGDKVVATIDGQVETWINKYAGGAAPSAPTDVPAPVPNNSGNGGHHHKGHHHKGHHHKGSSGGSGNSGKPFVPKYSGDWVQDAYYNSEQGVAKGLTFLNYNGGSGSGTWDYNFGNSLSYASSSGLSGSSSPQVLADTTIPSNKEVIIMSDRKCSDGGNCGYSRPGTVAMEGFGGDSKIFLFEFSMPDDGTSGFGMNMPALWLLNSQIPRTLQYGNPTCSCWKSGCGEFDLFEVLDSGNTKAKSTIHSVTSGGDSDYFNRPTGAPVKFAMVMTETTSTLKMLDSSFDFSKTLTNDDVNAMSSNSQTPAVGGVVSNILNNLGVSIFELASQGTSGVANPGY